MKKILRLWANLNVRLVRRYACATFGDIAEASGVGPCQRCVGMGLVGPAMYVPESVSAELESVLGGA